MADDRAETRRRKGRLIEWGDQEEGETCGLKGSKLAGGVVGGFAATGNPVPKGASQLPRPAIIRLSGVTISVNVLDFELRLEPGPTSVLYDPFDPALSRLPLASRHDFQAVSGSLPTSQCTPFVSLLRNTLAERITR
ncbi:hypothetical protein K0M31_001542 [Melipona bicolor]|uniref:Uncharacterized protein n=1 Tax=Melipona bicolor TaxID=60889 RepID=A0AA40KXQ2_9HYME|nr:hypothetical protein K0M31_001542 [Melipona bicolor]